MAPRTKKAPAEQTAAIEAYLAKTPETFRSALTHLRATIASAAPGATEALIYGVPGFRLNGKPLVCYAAFKAHCGFYPMNPALMDRLAPDLGDFRTSQGTIQFKPEKPLPDDLIRRIVTERVAEMTGGKR